LKTTVNLELLLKYVNLGTVYMCYTYGEVTSVTDLYGVLCEVK